MDSSTALTICSSNEIHKKVQLRTAVRPGEQVTDRADTGVAAFSPCYTFMMFTPRKQTKGSHDRGAWPWRGQPESA